MMNTDNISIKDIFVSRASGAGYYRPFIGLSYLADKAFWQMDPRAMHLDNIIMHVANVLFVFMLAHLSLRGRFTDSYLPFMAALLFGLHPITTESVNWISGRTDLMAGNFVLLSTICLTRYFHGRNKLLLLSALAMFFFALLSKEAAFGFFPAALVLATVHHAAMRKHDEPVTIKDAHSFILFLLFVLLAVVSALFLDNYWIVIGLGGLYLLVLSCLDARRNVQMRRVLLIRLSAAMAGLVCAVAIFKFLRRMAFTSDIDKISQTIKLMLDDSNYTISVFLGAVAFYLKKAMIPLPLNFYIREIDPLYMLAGIPLFFFCIYLFNKRSVSAALFLAGICMTLPALPFAFGTIAWTAYAERYIYISIAFWSISCCIYADSFLACQVRAGFENVNQKRIMFPAIILICFMAIVTLQRNFVWQTNLRLIGDTVRQSPNSKPLRGIYMVAFSEKGDTAAAKEQYYIASSLYSLQYDERFDINMANILASEGNAEEAEKYYNRAILKSKGKSVTALRAYLDFLDKQTLANKEAGKADDRAIAVRQLEILGKMYQLNKDPFAVYRMGQLALNLGQESAALAHFSTAAKKLPDTAPQYLVSRKIVNKLRNKVDNP